ncbi:uncharacterized protein LOC135702318 [Ochlerotatus camptorhynchus]|uniref:uncharacterized protein LOC135702318 n=1 Tax=Ochlerotatus camptorhynchus TaxID=644619 RepID=UPI0031DDB426
MAVPSGWVKKSFLFWSKLPNVKIEALRVSGQEYNGPTKKIAVIVYKTFKEHHLAEGAAEELSKREISDVDSKRKRLKPTKKPKPVTSKDYNMMVQGSSPTHPVEYDSEPLYVDQDGVMYFTPSVENANMANLQIAGSMSYEQMKADLKVFIEATVEKVVETSFQINFARFAALLEIQRKDDSKKLKPGDSVERHSRINTEDELIKWNIKLNNEELCRKYLEYFPKIIIADAYNDKGGNVCYTVVDCLFTREFWTKMTWTGISGSNKAKRGFREYGNVTQLLCSIVQIGDPSYTANKLEMFCRNRLFRYCKSRSTNRQLRKSACRQRHGHKSNAPTLDTANEEISQNSNDTDVSENVKQDAGDSSDGESEEDEVESNSGGSETGSSTEDE